MTIQETESARATEATPRLRRSPDDKVFAGVCGGLGEYFGIDPVWLRVAFVAMAFAGAGGGLILYLIAWIAIPERAADEERRSAPRHSGAQGTVIVGAALVAIGAIALINIAVPWVERLFWPGILIAIGAVMLWGGGSRDSSR